MKCTAFCLRIPKISMWIASSKGPYFYEGRRKNARLMTLDNLTENPSHRMSIAFLKLKVYPSVLRGTDHKIPYNCH